MRITGTGVLVTNIKSEGNACTVSAQCVKDAEGILCKWLQLYVSSKTGIPISLQPAEWPSSKR